jgi:O-antigen ligase
MHTQIPTGQSRDAPVFTILLGVATLILIPVALYVMFTVWPESLARQITATACILCVVAFLLIRKKYEAVFVGIIFLSQFDISLHTFPLAPPVVLQVFLCDVVVLLLILIAFERRERVRIDSMGRLFAAWIAWLVVCSFFSAHSQQSFLFVSWQVKFFVLYLLALNMTVSEAFIARVEKAVVGVLVIQAVIGLAQLLHHGGLGLDILGESYNAAKMDEYLVKGSLRISGTIGATNAFAGYMAILLVFLLPFVLCKRAWFRYAGFGAGFAALILSLSRAGWLGFVVGSLCAAFMMWRRRLLKISRVLMFTLFGCIAAVAAAFLYGDKIVDRFENREAIYSAQGRLDQFAEAAPLIEKFPVLGIGPGVSNFFSRWSDNRTFVRKALSNLTMPNYIHNSYLQAWVESGTPGLLLLLGIPALLLVAAVVGRSNSSGDNRGQLSDLVCVGGISGAIAVMVHITFGPELGGHRVFFIFWPLLGLARNELKRKRMMTEEARITLENEPTEEDLSR